MQRGNLDDLRALVAVARNEASPKRRRMLGVSQSALSQTIRLPSRWARRPASHPHHPQWPPTEAGERLLRGRAAVRGDRRRACDHRRPAEKPAGTIRITATSMQYSPCWFRNCRSCARVPGYQDRNGGRLWPHGHRCRALRRRCQKRRAGRERHDRGAHRAQPAHGGRGRSIILQEQV